MFFQQADKVAHQPPRIHCAATTANSKRSCMRSYQNLKSLHWLPIRTRINTYSFINSLQSSEWPHTSVYMLAQYEPAKTLRPTGSGLLTIQQTHSKAGAAAFCADAPRRWNTLPEDPREGLDYKNE